MEEDDELTPLKHVLEELPGLVRATIDLKRLDTVDVSHLASPEDAGDLPYVAIMRTDGGLLGETLLSCELRLDRTPDAMLSIELLTCCVRDWALSGKRIQFRAASVPPTAGDTALGRTLCFLIEYFHVSDSGDTTELMKIASEMTASIKDRHQQEHDCFDGQAGTDDGNADGLSIDQLEAVAASDPSVAYELARAYAAGEGVPQDMAAALRWYCNAASLGHSLSHYMAGYYYRNGQGTEVDYVKALEHYRAAAEADVLYAFAGIGEMLMKGLGSEADSNNGFLWYQKGALAGDPVCQAELGECYELGKGTPPDLAKARELYQQSLDQGFEMVQPALDRVTAALGQ